MTDGQPATVDVAAGVLMRPDGKVLLARRPPGKVYAGYWEFPGGKVERGESVPDALRRELQEELSVEVTTAYPWIVRSFVYPHATVRLHFYRVPAWRGELHAVEHDALSWHFPDSVDVAPLLPANGPVLQALALPCVYAISQAGEQGAKAFLERLDKRLASGLRLLQVREPGCSPAELEAFAADVVARAGRFGARVLVNGSPDVARRVGAAGVHLTASSLGTLRERPDLPLVGASCHDAEELRRAEALGADFAVLGPVNSTPTHPGQAPMGWQRFEDCARGCAIPVYALGGMRASDMEAAWSRGAHGVAMIRGAWEDS
jgi:8-oxo-dGTP diphosphatase